MKGGTMKKAMKKEYVAGIAAFSLVLLLGAGFASAHGFGKGYGFGMNLTADERAAVQEQNTAIRTAIENEDYSSWKSLMEARIEQMKESLTEENFKEITERHNDMQEMHEAMQQAHEEGNYTLMEEFHDKYGMGMKHRMMMRHGSEESHGMMLKGSAL